MLVVLSLLLRHDEIPEPHMRCPFRYCWRVCAALDRGEAKFNFDLDLELLNGHRKWPVRETYVGDLMALRHRIVVTAQRPWYTFNVYSQVTYIVHSSRDHPDRGLH